MREPYGENVVADLKEANEIGTDGDGQKGDSYAHARVHRLRMLHKRCFRFNGTRSSVTSRRHRSVRRRFRSGLDDRRKACRHWKTRALFTRVFIISDNHTEGRELRERYCLPNTRVFTDNKTLSHVPPPPFRRGGRKTRRTDNNRLLTAYPTNRSIRTERVLPICRSVRKQSFLFFVFFFGWG